MEKVNFDTQRSTHEHTHKPAHIILDYSKSLLGEHAYWEGRELTHSDGL